MTTTERVDLDDDEAFATFHDVYTQARDRDVDQPYSATEKRVGMRPDEYVDKVVLLARDDDGTPVAGGTAELPLRDNTRFVYVDVFTAPEHRRRGHGASVIEAIEEFGRDADRSILYGEAVWELDAVDPVPQAFSEAVGFRLDLMDAMRELPLPATLPALEVAEGYSVHSWRGACPEEWVQGYVDVRQLINEEAPGGEAELENEFWDVARVRAEEQQWDAQGRTPQVSIAVSDDGEVVGHTQLLFPADGRRGVPVGHPRAAAPSRPRARARPQGGDDAGGGRPARRPSSHHDLQRGRQRADDPRQRGARVPSDRLGGGVRQGALRGRRAKRGASGQVECVTAKPSGVPRPREMTGLLSQSLRNRTHLTEWSASLRSTRVARPRVVWMFSRRFGQLMVSQISAAWAAASSSVRAL